jgi:hypothetical protein
MRLGSIHIEAILLHDHTHGQIFRGFWHGSQLSHYQLLCTRSIVEHGHQFELFVYDPNIWVPDWICKKDARQILPTDHVMQYQCGWGAGSPSLHSNLFRYEMLHQLGGWWVDLDVMLLRSDLPDGEQFYFSNGRGSVATAVLRFASQDPLLKEAIQRSRAVPEQRAGWGQTGPKLMSELVETFSRTGLVSPTASAFPIDYHEIPALFDPNGADEVEERCANAFFLHLFNQLCRSAGLPLDAGPPRGSYLDRMLDRYKIKTEFAYRMRHSDIVLWIRNFTGYLHYESAYEKAARKIAELENRAAMPGKP